MSFSGARGTFAYVSSRHIRVLPQGQTPNHPPPPNCPLKGIRRCLPPRVKFLATFFSLLLSSFWWPPLFFSQCPRNLCLPALPAPSLVFVILLCANVVCHLSAVVFALTLSPLPRSLPYRQSKVCSSHQHLVFPTRRWTPCSDARASTCRPYSTPSRRSSTPFVNEGTKL